LTASTDNINEKVRQQLLYHMLNYTLPQFPPIDTVDIYNTLHFPRRPLEPPSKDPAPAPPWIPLPGGTLNNHSQRLRAATRDSKTYVAVDAMGEGGISSSKDPVQGTNCLLVGISEVIEVPPSLGEIIRNTPSLSYLVNILPESQLQALEALPGLTVFLPEDNAWDILHPVIRLYLESPFSNGDLKWIVGMHVADGKLGYTDRFGDLTKSKSEPSLIELLSR
jgi:solute carrier family 25 carnitine/acylcarnitine transporter 20/29